MFQSSGHEEFWYRAETNVHESLFSHVRGVEENQKHVHDANLLHAKLYSNRELLGVDWGTQIRRSGRQPLGPVTENVIQSVIDTATALIAKARPKPTIITDGAVWSLQRKAVELDKFLYAEFQRTGLFDMGPEVFRDACIFGTGFLKISAQDGKVCAERLMPDEIIVDERECLSTDPVQMHHRRIVDRGTLKALYPDSEEEIDKAQTADEFEYTSYRSNFPGQIIVVESWKLTQGKEKGRHTICIDGCTLEDEEYDEEVFPIVCYRWSKPLAGFYGQGLAEQLAGIQLRINKLNKFVDRAQELVATPRFLVPHGSRVKDSHITNAPGSIIHYTGQRPPTVWVGEAVSAEVFQRLESLKRSAFEFAGISQLSAQSKKPAGLESGVALREYSDIETARFSIQSQDYERFFLDCARHFIGVAKSIGSNYTARTWDSPNLMKTIKWSDVDMEDDRFVIKIEASSILSKTPAGRKSDILDLLAMQAIQPDDVPRLLGNPDIDRHRDLEDSYKKEAEAVVENLMKGMVEVPDELQNLPYTINHVQRTYLLIKRQGAPEDILELFRRFIVGAERLLQLAEPPMPPPEQAVQPTATEQGVQ